MWGKTGAVFRTVCPCLPAAGAVARSRAACLSFLVANVLEPVAGPCGISLSSDPTAEVVFSSAKLTDGFRGS